MAEDWKGQPKLSGIVESDETYVGGKPRYKKLRPGPRIGWGKETPVVSLVERGGNIRSFVTVDVTAANVGRILAENVSRDSHLMTDSAATMRKLISKKWPVGIWPKAQRGRQGRLRVIARFFSSAFSLASELIWSRLKTNQTVACFARSKASRASPSIEGLLAIGGSVRGLNSIAISARSPSAPAVSMR
jgi:hypothetical protein